PGRSAAGSYLRRRRNRITSPAAAVSAPVGGDGWPRIDPAICRAGARRAMGDRASAGPDRRLRVPVRGFFPHQDRRHLRAAAGLHYLSPQRLVALDRRSTILDADIDGYKRQCLLGEAGGVPDRNTSAEIRYFQHGAATDRDSRTRRLCFRYPWHAAADLL